MTKSTSPQINRRTVFAGAGAVGALAAVAAAMPTAEKVALPAEKLAEAEGSGGYQLTDHVKQYYATARV